MSGKAIWVASVWVLGYGIQIYMDWGWPNYLTTGIGLLCVLALYIIRLPRRGLISLLLLIVIAMGYYGGYNATNVSAIDSNPEAEGWVDREVVVQGMIASPPEVDGDRVSFVLMAEHLLPAGGKMHTLNERMQVSMKLTKQSEQTVASGWQRGDRLTLRSTLERPSVARNFGGFDYRRYLYEQRIHWLLTAKGTDSAKHESIPFEVSAVQLLRWTDKLRLALSSRIDQVFPAESAPFMKGILIGMSDELDPERFAQFSALGLTHIIAISGLHVSVLVGALIWIMKRLGLTRETYLLVCICFLPIYVLLTGASPSIVRAGAMAMLALWATRQRWGKDALYILCIVAVGLLIWKPYYIHSISFQLSFIVTAGLIWAVPRVTAMLPKLKPWLSSTISVTIVSQLVSFPVSIYYFNQFSLLSPIANMLLIPVFSMIVYPFGLLALSLGFIWLPLGQWIGEVVGWINAFAFFLMEWMELWKGRLIWPTPTLLWIGIYYGLLSMIFLFSKAIRTYRHHTDPGIIVITMGAVKRYQFLAKIGICMSLFSFTLLLFVGYTPDRWSPYGSIQFLDVGQGDAILIRTRAGKHVLVDGGGTVSFRKAGDEWRERHDPYDVGRKLVVPLLRNRGVHQIDMLILTHQDEDHSGGLKAVIKDIPVRSFLFNGTFKQGPSNTALFQSILSAQIPMYAAENGQIFQIDNETTITVLYPNLQSGKISLESDQNESSIVFLLEMNGVRLLFTGDIGQSTESLILADTTLSFLPINVLKVAHHGSKTSSSLSWLQRWKPETGVISVGVNNRYKHPSDETLQKMNAQGIQVLRTDLLGEIQGIVRKGKIEWRAKLIDNNGD